MPAGRQQFTLLDPQALYEQWERQHWAAHEIDLGRDREDWLAMPLGLRERLLWHIAAFFVGEERVTYELGPLLAAADTPSEAAFVATQLADEARHAQHFDRFYEHVAGRGGDFSDRLAAARSDIGAPLVALLDDRLAQAARRLAAAPRNHLAKLDFVVLYHMIIEGMIAIAGQHVLLDFLDRRALLPGWREGLRHIVRDEHRHVAYGTWVLRELAAADPAARHRIAEQLAELEPLAAEVLLPRGARGQYFRPLGWTGEQVQELGLGALRRRLRATGLVGCGDARGPGFARALVNGSIEERARTAGTAAPGSAAPGAAAPGAAAPGAAAPGAAAPGSARRPEPPGGVSGW